ncbi:MAG: DEAD/DEAH box helicase [Spirochaetes bacterium RBG_16_49_21]|nr:MAG: DEAD/DEAH box helicase [Spirochaetes bacterium RBG_16_49_21]
MQAFTEDQLEQAALEWFKDLGYAIIFGPDIAFDGKKPERKDYASPILEDRLREALSRINKKIPAGAIEEAIRKITISEHPSLIVNNRTFQKMITDGVDVQYKRPDGSIKNDKVWLFDYNDPDNNNWLAAHQFTLIENNHNRRPDVVIFLNGIPLAVIELKSAAEEETTDEKAFRQMQTYIKEIPSLFVYNSFCVISDGLLAKAGTITSNFERFMSWRADEGGQIRSLAEPQLATLIKGMFSKERFLDIIKHFVLFQDDGKEIVKILAGYHQYHAVNKALENTDRAVSSKGDRRIGVVWHTQGSGKSLTMVFYTGKLVLSMDNPTIVVITDRNDLDDQLFGTFCKSAGILRQIPKQAETRAQLRELLSVESGGIIFTTIQKFSPFEEEDSFPLLTDRKNVIVIADEAHRSQYGFSAEVRIAKGRGSSEVKFGYAKYLRDALPNASFIGFTGTPIDLEDKSTRAVFGDYIDIYDMTRSVEDKSTVRIYYESRIIKLGLDENVESFLDDEFEEITEYQEETYKDKLKTKWARMEAVVGSENRIRELANDIVKHYEIREKDHFGKAMIVVMSRRIAVALYEEIVKLRPGWHSDDDDKGKIKVVMTGSASDPKQYQPHARTKKKREDMAGRMKKVDDDLKIVIVRDMWLTGFDVPSLDTMYLDKPMRGHSLMQAIARVNRVFEDKEGGLVVDYIGIAYFLKEALAQYTESDRDTAGIDTSRAVAVMREKYEIIKGILHKFDYSGFLSGSPSQRMQVIIDAVNFVMGLAKDQELALLKTVAELEKAHSLCATSSEATAVALEIGFFKAVKASVIKIRQENIFKKTGKTREDIEFAVNQLVSKSIISEEVIDVFEALHMDRPELSILSEKFLEEIRGLKQKNLAAELLKRLIEGKIKFMSRKQLVESKKFSDRLKEALQRYINQGITNIEIIEELIKMAQDIDASTRRGEGLGLSEEELAFYDALCVSDAAVKIMGDDILKQIAHDLAEAIRKNITIDWNLKESVRAKMRTVIRRLLKKYGYPPDQQPAAIKTVMEQAELLCDEESMGYGADRGLLKVAEPEKSYR